MQRNDYFTKLHYTFKADLREYEDQGAIIIPNHLYDMAKGWEARKWYEEERQANTTSAAPETCPSCHLSRSNCQCLTDITKEALG
jgi:hypothetical protein